MQTVIAVSTFFATLIAAVFAYLGWVDQNQKTKSEVEDKIQRRYETVPLGTNNLQYTLEVHFPQIRKSESLCYRIRRLLLPSQGLEGNTTILLYPRNGKPNKRAVEFIDQKPDLDINCEMTDTGYIRIVIDSCHVETVSMVMDQFVNVLAKVESTVP